MKKISCYISLLLLLGFTGSHGLEIDFDSGYKIGPLSGQPVTGTQWMLTNGRANIIEVVSGQGESGSNGIQGISTGTGANYVYYGFDASDEDLNGTFDADHSIVQYSFQWKSTDSLDGPITSPIFVFSVGSNDNTASGAAVKLTIRSSGRLVVADGESNQPIDGLFTPNEYVTISGTIDYRTKTYTVFVDGNQLFASIGGRLAFENPDSDNAYIRLGNINGASVNHRNWFMDNLSLSITRR